MRRGANPSMRCSRGPLAAATALAAALLSGCAYAGTVAGVIAGLSSGGGGGGGRARTGDAQVPVAVRMRDPMVEVPVTVAPKTTELRFESSRASRARRRSSRRPRGRSTGAASSASRPRSPTRS